MASDQTPRLERRRVLKAAASSVISVTTGCSGMLDGDDSAGTPRSTRDTTSQPDWFASLEREPSALPRVWSETNDVARHYTVLEINPALDDYAVKANGEAVENGFQGQENTFGIAPKHLADGENTVEIVSGGETRTLAVDKKEPRLKKLDVVPEENEGLRETITEELGESEAHEYLEQHAVAGDNTVFSSYQTPEELGYNKYGVDLAAMEHWHDNDFIHIGDNKWTDEMHRFVESINLEDDILPDVKDKDYEKARDIPEGMNYPNSEGESNTWGYFDFQEFSGSETAQEALDWLHPYLFAWESNYTEDVISTEDEKYAAVIQESLDRYTDIETHVWGFDLPESMGSTHGNGFVWDETNDELLIMETVKDPRSEERSGAELIDPQLHPVLRDSNYLNPDHDVYDHWWHPIRFDGTEPEINRLDFKEGKGWAAAMFNGIATAYSDTTVKQEERGIFDEPTVGLTTEYLADAVGKLRNYNENDFEFRELVEQSKIFQDMMKNREENYLIGGTIENPVYVAGISENFIDSVWNDEQGQYDDIDRMLEENPDSLLA